MIEVDGAGIAYHGSQPPVLGPLDVLFDEARVCSVAPERARASRPGVWHSPWPPGLLRYLVGSSRVRLRVHTTGQDVFDEEVCFTEDPDRVAVVDEEGLPLAFDKWDQPGRAFEASHPAAVEELVNSARELLSDLTDGLGLPAFIAYGTLLGAVRDGRVIGHDFDADVAYVSDHTHPADVARQSFWLQRRLVELGWRTERPCDSMYQVRVSRGGAQAPYLDIFPSYFRDGQFEVPPLARGPLRREQLLPLRPVVIEGVPLAAPADPEAVLALTYGESWRVPDPAFRFEVPPDHARRMSGVMGNHLARPGRWRRWYREDPEVVDSVSDFGRWVSDQLDVGTQVLDLGCGTGADTVALASRTGCAWGLDYAAEALAVGRSRAAEVGAPAEFQHTTLYDLRAVLGQALGLTQASEAPPALYARLTLDALGPSGRTNLLLAARAMLRGRGGRAYFEVRTRPGNPFAQRRRAPWAGVVDVEELRADLTARGGTVVHLESVPGPSPQWGAATELSRLVVQW